MASSPQSPSRQPSSSQQSEHRQLSSSQQQLFAPHIKRLVDTVDRGPEDDYFYPAGTDNTVFRRVCTPYQNAVPEIVEIGYQGSAAWGGRITIPLQADQCGDLLSWVAIRLQPQSWLGPNLEAKINSGVWDYADPSGAWMWAASLGTIAIASAELQINGQTIEQWPGEWMDLWSRMMLDGGRAMTWDTDVYGQLPPWVLRDVGRPAWTTIRPTEDGYVYCWLPLCFLRRPKTAFPLVALGPQTEMRLIVNFRPFSEVVRRRAIPRSSPSHVPLGETVTLVDKSGGTHLPYTFTMPSTVPGFEDVTVLAGVVKLDEPLRSSYMHVPLEMLYMPVTYMRFDQPVPTVEGRQTGELVTGCPQPLLQSMRLLDMNGPMREIVWFVRRKSAWQYNEWTNYGAFTETQLMETVPLSGISMSSPTTLPIQQPLVTRATLYGGNAIWRDEPEYWWRADWGLSHRGGVRAAAGMVYGFQFGWAPDWAADDYQTAMTFNASRADLRLDLLIAPPPATIEGCSAEDTTGWDVHVFGVSVNWMRFVEGVVQPLFSD